VYAIKPAPENDHVYNVIQCDDPDILELARSIEEVGLQEPILISRDGYILSGHRRRVAAVLAGLKQVPVRIHPISRGENPDAFTKLLVEMNSQRIKSQSVLLHESLIKIEPKTAHQKIVNDRKAKEQERSLNGLSARLPAGVWRDAESMRKYQLQWSKHLRPKTLSDALLFFSALPSDEDGAKDSPKYVFFPISERDPKDGQSR
jgi:hypothetical protein